MISYLLLVLCNGLPKTNLHCWAVRRFGSDGITLYGSTIVLLSSEAARKGICGTSGYVGGVFENRLKEPMDQPGFSEDSNSPSLLQGDAKMQAQEDGKGFYNHTIKSGFQPDIHLANSLVSLYIKSGRVVDARQVFDRMPKRSMISWNAMIAGLARHGHGEEALAVFREMQRDCVKPNKITFISILNTCASPRALEQGKWLHASIIKAGFESDIRVGNALVSMYCKCGSMADAHVVFYKMPERDVITWTALISGSAQLGHGEEALELYWQMQQEGLKPNKVTFISILNACASKAALEHGKQLHVDIIQAGLQSDIPVGNALVSMYWKCGSVVDANQVFFKMRARDVVSWTAMIAGSAQCGDGEEAFELFQQMQQEGVKPNKVTFIGILSACANPAALEQGKRLHVAIIKAGFISDVRVGTALVRMYFKCGSVEDAHQVFFQMPEQDVVSWDALIAGFAQHGHAQEALELFWQMQGGIVKPDTVTFISILNACTSPAALEQGKRLHTCIIKAGCESDVRLGNALVNMYCKCGSIVDARRVFFKMPERDVISWTTMIGGSAQHGQGEEAFKFFQQMQEEGVKPNKVTFMSILEVCASLGTLAEGKWVHAHIIKSESELDVCVGNALVDMYTKCGSVGDARQVFDKILEQDVYSWNVMIIGYAQHGHGKEAIQLFEQMPVDQIKPDNITFIGVLFACSHMGLVEEGRHYLLSMNRDHGITPTGKHYGCMVDLLGRAGHLDEAEDFINKMPFEPDPPVLGALLGACRVHGNVDVAERTAERLLNLEPQNAAWYVLLSNIYAVAGKWDAVAKVRKVMEDRNVKKEPGCSWIEVNNKRHTFLVADKSHAQTKEIYSELERLTRLIKDAGYVPNTGYVLHDVDQGSKEQALSHHSEKLAIAFGLISMPPGKPIHITKNLRVCGDCHTATKFISKIVGCEIFARDANRLHHFKNGTCSCGDFW